MQKKILQEVTTLVQSNNRRNRLMREYNDLQVIKHSSDPELKRLFMDVKEKELKQRLLRKVAMEQESEEDSKEE